MWKLLLLTVTVLAVCGCSGMPGSSENVARVAKASVKRHVVKGRKASRVQSEPSTTTEALKAQKEYDAVEPDAKAGQDEHYHDDEVKGNVDSKKSQKPGSTGKEQAKTSNDYPQEGDNAPVGNMTQDGIGKSNATSEDFAQYDNNEAGGNDTAKGGKVEDDYPQGGDAGMNRTDDSQDYDATNSTQAADRVTEGDDKQEDEEKTKAQDKDEAKDEKNAPAKEAEHKPGDSEKDDVQKTDAPSDPEPQDPAAETSTSETTPAEQQSSTNSEISTTDLRGTSNGPETTTTAINTTTSRWSKYFHMFSGR